MPLAWALALGRFFGLVWYYVIPIRRSVARRNIERAYGADLSPNERRRLVRGCFVHLGMYAVEVLRIPSMTRETAERWLKLEGQEHLDTALAKGRGVLFVSSHVGNIDLAGTALAIRGYPITVVAKDLGRFTQPFVTQVRERTGVIIIAPRRSRERIEALLAENKVVVLIVDQHVAPYRSIVCDFFGQLAATSHAPARFGFDTDATLLRGVTFRRRDGTHVARIEGSFELEEPHAERVANLRHNTERINRWVEAWVREFPEQWHWVHKRWKVHDDPEGWEVPEELQPLLDR